MFTQRSEDQTQSGGLAMQRSSRTKWCPGLGCLCVFMNYDNFFVYRERFVAAARTEQNGSVFGFKW